VHDSHSKHIQLAAAIHLANFVKKNFSPTPNEDTPTNMLVVISRQDKQFMKNHIVESLARASVLVRK
jgi:hypothetical protein